MSKVTIELNYEGVGQLLKSESMQSGLNLLANEIVNGDGGYEIKDIVAPTRAIATIQTITKEKMQANLDNNELLTKL